MDAKPTASVNNFELKSDVHIPVLGTNLQTWIHSSSGMKFLHCPLPGPLCHVSVIVGTEAPDDRGLPHTLEHLIFMGSKELPYKGYLDTLANRCLTQGTNAMTDQTNTTYTVSTAGPEGVYSIIGPYLEHILLPQLDDRSFVTEVYHVDGEGRDQGVVYCEMSGRENTDDDIRSLWLDRMLFPNCGYSYSCGGLTDAIRRLSNDDIRRYHEAMYNPANTTVVVTGQLEIARMCQQLDRFMTTYSSYKIPPPVKQPWTDPVPAFTTSQTLVKQFPAADNEIGSVTFGWRGPSFDDITTITALDVLFRYLQDTISSPLTQRFVQIKSMASTINYNLVTYAESSLSINFYGVSAHHHATGQQQQQQQQHQHPVVVAPVPAAPVMSETEELLLKRMGSSSCEEDVTEGDEDEEEDLDGHNEDAVEQDAAHVPYSAVYRSMSETEDSPDDQLLEPGVIRAKMFGLFQYLCEHGFPEGIEHMQSVVRRHLVKHLEQYEDTPSGTLLENLTEELIFRKQYTHPSGAHYASYGDNIDLTNILKQLVQQPMSFWQELLRKWLVDAPVAELILVPDMELAEQLEREEEEKIAERARQLGPDGLEACAERVRSSVEYHERPLPSNCDFGVVPLADTIPSYPYQYHCVAVPELPFPVHMCNINTHFYHVQLLVDTQKIAPELRLYFVLLSDLLGESDLFLSNGQYMTYTEVADAYLKTTVHMESGCGINGGSQFSPSCFGQFYDVYILSEPHRAVDAVLWMKRFLTRSVFTRERVLASTKTLLRELHELRRDGSTVCEDMNNLYFEVQRDHLSNELGTSSWVQEKFLHFCLYQLQQSEHVAESVVRSKTSVKAMNALNPVSAKLHQLLEELISDPSCFIVQLDVPHDYMSNQQAIDTFASVWLNDVDATAVQPRTYTMTETQDKLLSSVTIPNVPSPTHQCILCPVKAVDNAFVQISVPCPVNKHHPDYYPLLIMCELLSRSEGILSPAMRGQGLTYGAEMAFVGYYGYLSFDLYESSSVDKCLTLLVELLREVQEGDGLTEFEVETAKAAIMYDVNSKRATSGSIINDIFKMQIRGFRTSTDEILHESKLQQVTVAQVEKVFRQYFTPFLHLSSCLCCIVANPSTCRELETSLAAPPLNLSPVTRSLCAQTELALSKFAVAM